MKLVRRERETGALMAALAGLPERASSELARAEVLRAVARVDDELLPRARRVVGDLGLMPIDRLVLERAAALRPFELRTLDAIHLASAQALSDDLRVLIGYDERLLDAAAGVGIEILAPR